ncbi:MAG: ABC transporter ATP-binding protein [Proteobacteria bacterium]|nr:MAG: ABC transporter ATP-binding protein [Pseudomonadota bacterium]
MLRVENVSRSFGNKSILRDVTFELPLSSVTGLIGPGAGGKSTLLKIIAHVARSDSGHVRFNNENHYEVSLMFQEGALFDSLSVFDNVAFPLVSGKVPIYLLGKRRKEEVAERVSNVLARVGLSRAAHKIPAQLSGGMRRRVSLARALVARPKLLLLDDPTCGLDPVASSVIMDLILELHREYKPTILLVSHDLRRLLPVVDVVLALFEGRVGFLGCLSELRGIESPMIRRFVECRYDLQ